MQLKDYIDTLGLADNDASILIAVLSDISSLNAELNDEQKEKIGILIKTLDHLSEHGEFCECGALILEGHSTTHQGTTMCLTCFDSKFFRCTDCQQIHPRSLLYTEGDSGAPTTCIPCIEKKQKTCPACGRKTTTLSEFSPNEFMCINCYSNASSRFGMSRSGGNVDVIRGFVMPDLAPAYELPNSVKEYLSTWYSSLSNSYYQNKTNRITHYYMSEAIEHNGYLALGQAGNITVDFSLLYSFIMKLGTHILKKDGKEMDKRFKLIYKEIESFVSVANGIITYTNPKGKQLSTKINSFMSYLETFIKGLSSCPHITPLSIEIVRNKFYEIKMNLDSVVKGFKIRLSNDIEYKLKFAQDMQKYLSTCQKPDNCCGHSSGFYDWFVNGQNIILGIFDSSDRICGRILCRLYYDKDGNKCIFVDRPYINSDLAGQSNKNKVITESIVWLKSLGYKVLISNESTHDSGNTKYFDGNNYKSCDYRDFYQPSRILNFTLVGYYCDSGTENISLSDNVRQVTTRLPLSLFIIN